MKIKWNRKSLAIKMVAITLSMIFLLMIVGIILLQYMGKVSTEKTLALYAEEAVENSKNYMDVPTYKQFLEQQKEDDVYRELKTSMNDFREKADLLYVYTISLEDDKSYVMINGQPENAEVQTAIKEETTTYSPELLQSVLDGAIISTEIRENEIYGDFLTALAPLEDENGNAIGIIAVDISAEKVQTITDNVMKKVLPIVLIVFVVIFIVTSIGLLYYVLKQMRPLQTIKEIAEKIAVGNLKAASEQITSLPNNRQDEVGQLSTSFEVMVEELEDVMTQVATTSELVAASSEELFASADQSLEANRQMEQLMEGFATGAQTQHDYVEQTAMNMQEMNTGIETIASAATNATNSAVQVLEEAQAGHETIEKVVTQMQAINDTNLDIEKVIQRLVSQSKRIEEMLYAITDIAEQTNLLALNAAIEAARAGEHGRGFAIVAEEVRTLADQSKQSVDEIAQLIQTIHVDVEQAVVTMDKGKQESETGIDIAAQTTKAMEEIIMSIQCVTNEMQDVSASTQQMAATSDQVNDIMKQVETITNTVVENTKKTVASIEGQSSAMEDVTSASHDLSLVGQKLQEMLHKFTL
ncbi:methyl-accepting chemotaxis protein [Pseudogracilibacillus sp. ICA-222130]|uniref:methyl-accepting chemotaxis protein n=1 Tax=Pseudogracilibacillus sp. ICA-222130 TaxID=3134655 RepID=UPI0030C4FFA4